MLSPQVHFHFQTWKLGKERVLLDDSRKIGKKEPMVLVIGHKFKLECWETIVKMMAVGEVSSFKVQKEVSNFISMSRLSSNSLFSQGLIFPMPANFI